MAELRRRARADAGLFATPTNQNSGRYYRPRRYGLSRRDSNPLTSAEWCDLVRYSRELYAQLGNLGGAIRTKNTYAVGDSWKPQFLGTDKAWGQEAEAFLRNQFYPLADMRGQQFDFTTSLMIDAIAMDIDGDSLCVFTKTANNFPKLAFYSASRIGSRFGETEVKGGKFNGAKIENGVITSARGRRQVLGYRILGVTEDEDFDVAVRDCQLLFEPEWQQQERGIPRVGQTLLDWFDVQDIDTFLKRGVKLESSIGLIHYTESGEAETSSSFIAEDTGAANTETEDIHIEYRDGGEMFYAKANSGEKLESFKGDRPHPNTEAFIARLERRGLYAVGWPYELIDPSKVGGASVRAIQNQARTSIRARQKTIRKRALRCVQYAIAVAMKHGRISRTTDAWWRWDFETPALLTVDEGHDHKADVENVRAGFMTESEFTAKRGKWWEDVRQGRKREVEQILADARELATEYKITMGSAVDLLYQRSPNPVPFEPEKTEGSETEELKRELDAYGVGVRAGALTPTQNDENHFREKAGLPNISNEAQAYWKKEGNVRRPITLTQPDGQQSTAQSDDEETE